MRRPRAPLTGALVLLNVALFAAAAVASGALRPAPDVLASGWNYAPAVAAGQSWRLVTACFLHGDLAHLTVNMLALWYVGRLLEQRFGPAQVLGLYLVCGLAGSIASYRLGQYASVGASGAVLGLLGAGWAAGRRWGDETGELGRPMFGWLAANLALGALLPRIDQWAHLGGAVSGALLGGLVVPRTNLEGWRRGVANGAGAGAALVILVALGLAGGSLRRAQAGGDGVTIPAWGVHLRLPEGWVARPLAEGGLSFGPPGLPVGLTLQRTAAAPPTGAEVAWLLTVAADLPRLAGPVIGRDEVGRVTGWQRLRPGPIVEQYVWFGQTATLELLATAPAEGLRRWRPWFDAVAASLRWDESTTTTGADAPAGERADGRSAGGAAADPDR